MGNTANSIETWMAEDIANVFFDKQDIEIKPGIFKTLTGLFATRAQSTFENRFPTLAEARDLLIKDTDYTRDDAEKLTRFLKTFMVDAFQMLVFKKALQNGNAMLSDVVWSDHLYLGVACKDPVIDLREKAEFIAKTKENFTQRLAKLLAVSMSPPATHSQSRPAAPSA